MNVNEASLLAALTWLRKIVLACEPEEYCKILETYRAKLERKRSSAMRKDPTENRIFVAAY